MRIIHSIIHQLVLILEKFKLVGQKYLNPVVVEARFGNQHVPHLQIQIIGEIISGGGREPILIKFPTRFIIDKDFVVGV